MTTLTLILFVLGLGILFAGAELLVRGASRLAAAGGISPLIVGLTVVAFGTSAPEMAVSIQSSLAGQADIAVGNVVGSNIFNVLFILGLSSIIAPLIVAQQFVRLEVPIMIGISVLLWFFASDGVVSRRESLMLFSGIILYTVYLIRQSRKEKKAIEEEYATEFGIATRESTTNVLPQIVFVLVGLAMLVLGSRWLVDGAVQIARALGLSELVIGLTIVAAGTSLPEVATSVIAAFKGERDIAVGNVIGSSIFNILAVLGLSGVVSSAGINVSRAALSFDIPVMTAVAAACLPILFTGNLIARWEGGVFLFYYVAYVAYLILGSTNHDGLPVFSAVTVGFVLPITVITVAVFAVREYGQKRREDSV